MPRENINHIKMDHKAQKFHSPQRKETELKKASKSLINPTGMVHQPTSQHSHGNYQRMI